MWIRCLHFPGALVCVCARARIRAGSMCMCVCVRARVLFVCVCARAGRRGRMRKHRRRKMTRHTAKSGSVINLTCTLYCTSTPLWSPIPDYRNQCTLTPEITPTGGGGGGAQTRHGVEQQCGEDRAHWIRYLFQARENRQKELTGR